jgi:hypothetical protein
VEKYEKMLSLAGVIFTLILISQYCCCCDFRVVAIILLYLSHYATFCFNSHLFRSVGSLISLLLFLLHYFACLNPCHGLPSCKAEKAINHMTKIQNVDSYVYNDTHLLNINNKGIKVIRLSNEIEMKFPS